MSTIHHILAKIVYGSQIIDRGFRKYGRLREKIALKLCHPEFMQSYNEIAYAHMSSYLADSPDFEDELFAWEKHLIEEYFPAPPARILIGGAGGGREAFSLAEQGYEIMAFDIAKVLVKSMQQRIGSLPIKAFHGAYEDLWGESKNGSELPSSKELGVFDAFIIGWGSFSHLLDEHDRLQLLRTAKSLVPKGAPILLSFLPAVNTTGKHLQNPEKAREVMKTAAPTRPHDFQARMGFIHRFHENEILSLFEEAELELCYNGMFKGTYPHMLVKAS